VRCRVEQRVMSGKDITAIVELVVTVSWRRVPKTA
jgi:hypothetical protein